MTDLVIRQVERSDLSGLLDLYSHLDGDDVRCPAALAPEIYERFLRYEGSRILVGEIGSDLVASCTIAVVPNLTRGGLPYALVENVVTHIDHRNRGFGKAILKAAVDHAWDYHCYKVMLLTGSRKPSTIAFYHAAGFEQTKTGFQVRR